MSSAGMELMGVAATSANSTYRPCPEGPGRRGLPKRGAAAHQAKHHYHSPRRCRLLRHWMLWRRNSDAQYRSSRCEGPSFQPLRYKGRLFCNTRCAPDRTQWPQRQLSRCPRYGVGAFCKTVPIPSISPTDECRDDSRGPAQVWIRHLACRKVAPDPA